MVGAVWLDRADLPQVALSHSRDRARAAAAVQPVPLQGVDRVVREHARELREARHVAGAAVHAEQRHTGTPIAEGDQRIPALGVRVAREVTG